MKINEIYTINNFFEKWPVYSADEQEKIKKAWNTLCSITADRKRADGEPFCEHPLRVAFILASLKMDCDTIIGGLFHNLPELENCNLEQIKIDFGPAVHRIMMGTGKITTLKVTSKTMQQAESIRRMLFAIIDDIRIIIVKLADRLDRMRNLKSLSIEEQKATAQEVLDIWAPLANRLGISSLKDEMEDLTLKVLHPDVYEQIKRIVALKKNERDSYLEKAQKEIYKAAAKNNIEITISSRAKHFYSIYQKMRKRNKEADELFDLLALRIFCDNQYECYTLVGLVHTLWKPLDGRFKDYIAMPKSNGYQSLHTTVMCDGSPLEIQIRTHEMHAVAENGVASHWLYKKGSSRETVNVQQLALINQLKELKNNKLDDEEFLREIKEEVLGDSIFVFTPKGDVIQLPSGSTAIDFAYAIHSAIGEKITGAKANGQIIPLSQPLKNTQSIDILTSPHAHPTLNQLEFVKTAKARNKIRSWLLQNDPQMLDRANAQKQELVNQQSVAQQAALRLAQQKSETASSVTDTSLPSHEPVKIRVGDTTNFMITIARCCNPVYGDDIIGYVSRGRGIIIHKKNCPNFEHIPHIDVRSIAVVWEQKPVEIKAPVKPKKKAPKTSRRNI